MILFFSATGNSRFAAGLLADILKDTLVSLNEVFKNGQKWEFYSEAPFVLVAPVYAWRLPAVIEELLKKAPDFDLILTAESKGIPLAYEMSRESGKKYVLARKSPKLYMKKPIKIEVKSITTAKLQELYLDQADADLLNGKRVLIVDDVISTGESLKALEGLLEQTGAIIVAKMAVLAEGDAAKRNDIIFLEHLPLFFKD